MMEGFRIGQGIDFHRLEAGSELWLGGIRIPAATGAVAHSDGDVLIHSICDALFGAAGMRDIGFHFPDSDPSLKGIDSKILLEKTVRLISGKGFTIMNIDTTVLLESPKISEYIPEMRRVISGILEINPENISVKATTTEKMGFTGRGEGICAMAVALLRK